MFRFRRRIGEGQSGLFNHTIGAGQPSFVLPKVFLPGGDAEDFDEPVRTFTVSVQVPADRPGSAAGNHPANRRIPATPHTLWAP